jgi:hypothetical protein
MTHTINIGRKLNSAVFNTNGTYGIGLRGGNVRVNQKYRYYGVAGVPVAIDGNGLGTIGLPEGIFGCVGEALLKVNADMSFAKTQELMDQMELAIAEDKWPQIVITGQLLKGVEVVPGDKEGFPEKLLAKVNFRVESAEVVYEGEAGWVQPERDWTPMPNYTVGSGRTRIETVTHKPSITEAANVEEDITSLII